MHDCICINEHYLQFTFLFTCKLGKIFSFIVCKRLHSSLEFQLKTCYVSNLLEPIFWVLQCLSRHDWKITSHRNPCIDLSLRLCILNHYLLTFLEWTIFLKSCNRISPFSPTVRRNTFSNQRKFSAVISVLGLNKSINHYVRFVYISIYCYFYNHWFYVSKI